MLIERVTIHQRLGRRAVPLVIVVLLHALTILAALTLRAIREVPVQAPVALQVSLLQQAAEPDTPPPAPVVTLEQPVVDVPVPPVVIIDLPPSPTAITLPARQVAAAASSSVSASVMDVGIDPPRFDAAYLNNPPPAYPPVSRRRREQGVVVLRVRVTTQGSAAQVIIDHSSGSPRLDSAAASAVALWRFVPARRGEQAIEAWVLVPIEFELRG